MGGRVSGYEHVPTLPELHQKGLATVEARSPKTQEPTHYRATPEGQRIIDETMRRNGEYLRAHPDESAARTRQSIIDAKALAAAKKK